MHLTPKVFQTLRVLFVNRHRIVTRQELIDEVWDGQFVEDATITQTVSVLRRSLVSVPNAPPMIGTFPGRGYRFVAKAEPVPGGATSPDVNLPDAVAPGLLSGSPDLAQDAKSSRIPNAVRRSMLHRIAVALVLVALITYAILMPTESYSRVTISEWNPVAGTPGMKFEPTLSPDGEYLAYVLQPASGPAKLVVSTSGAAGAEETVFDGAGEISSLAWAPDGQKIAFLFGSNAAREIVIVDLAEKTHRSAGSVFPHRYGLPFRMLSWSADGKKIAVSDKEHHDQAFNIRLLHLENGSRTVVSYPHRSTVGDVEPVFSPDGSMLAFQRMISWVSSDVYATTLPSTEARRITSRAEPLYGVNWTPDGENLIYSMLRHGEYKLFAHSLALGTIQDLGAVSKLPFQFSLPRHGPRIAYANYPLKPGLSILDLTASGADFQPFAYSTSEDGSAQFSPDGRWVAFQSSRSGSSQIWLCNAEGEELRQLSFEAEPPQYPNWSPDSTKVVSMIGSGSDREVVLFDILRGGRQLIAIGDGGGSHAGFSPDGKSVYFKRGISLYRVPVDGGEPIHVADQVGFPIRFDAGTNSLLYARSRTSADLWSVDVRFHHARRMLEGLLFPGCFSCWTALADEVIYIGEGPDGDVRPWLTRMQRTPPYRRQSIRALDHLPPIGTAFVAAHPDGSSVIVGSMVPDNSEIYTATFSPGWAGRFSRSE